jgi:hypothetical protein
VRPQILVVSDPPQNGVDYEAVSATLGMDVEDARLKIGFSAPEVLLVSDPAPAVDFAATLRSLGMRVSVVDGRDLVGLPWPAPVSDFVFQERGLRVCAEGAPFEIGYDEPVVAALCSPPPGLRVALGHTETRVAPGLRGMALSEAIEWMPNLDLYVRRPDGVRRLSVVQDLADFSSIGTGGAPATPEDGMALLLDECVRRFRHIEIDRRLEGVRPRQRFETGRQDFDLDLRKLYSFGTLLLRQALDAISPDLKHLTQYELGSRMAFVLSGQRSSGR